MNKVALDLAEQFPLGDRCTAFLGFKARQCRIGVRIQTELPRFRLDLPLQIGCIRFGHNLCGELQFELSSGNMGEQIGFGEMLLAAVSDLAHLIEPVFLVEGGGLCHPFLEKDRQSAAGVLGNTIFPECPIHQPNQSAQTDSARHRLCADRLKCVTLELVGAGTLVHELISELLTLLLILVGLDCKGFHQKLHLFGGISMDIPLQIPGVVLEQQLKQALRVVVGNKAVEQDRLHPLGFIGNIFAMLFEGVDECFAQNTLIALT